MLDIDRITKAKTDVINVSNQMDSLINVGIKDFLSDPKSPLALKYLLIEAVEAIADICQHLLARIKGIACEGYVDCIMKTGKAGIITPSLSDKLRQLADLRNNLIHRYWIIDHEQLYNQTVDNRRYLKDFVEQTNTFLLSIKEKDKKS
jgi:uncharacterized protein YutE (UPF0331/DUF86 family)